MTTQTIELRLAELELRCEEYRLLDETADAIPSRMTPDLSRFTYIGPQAERLLGISQNAWYEPGFFEARLAADERGSITLDSTVGVDSTFYVRIPIDGSI